MTSIFWSNNPQILFNKKYVLELWPTSNMCYEEKLNAISRLVIILSVLGFTISKKINILITGIITLFIIFLYYKLKSKSLKKNKEGFSNKMKKDGIINNNTPLTEYLSSDYYSTNDKNPLSNVLLPEIKYDPKRKSAPPSFNNEVYGEINETTKKTIQNLNPGIKTTNSELFGDLGENFEFDQSMRSFYSNPATQIPNDQGAFAQYLYGNMPSCRDGDAFACVQDNQRYILI